MADLFGIDIAGLIYDATNGQLISGTLARKTKNGIKNFVFEGAPDDLEETVNAQALSSTTKQRIVIIARSIVPTTTPRNRDILKFQDKEFTILSVTTDGAEATHTCFVSLR